MDLGFNHVENKEKIDLFPKLRIEKIGDEYVFCEPLEDMREKLSVSLMADIFSLCCIYRQVLHNIHKNFKIYL